MSSSAKADDPVFRDVSVQPRGCGVLDAPLSWGMTVRENSAAPADSTRERNGPSAGGARWSRWGRLLPVCRHDRIISGARNGSRLQIYAPQIISNFCRLPDRLMSKRGPRIFSHVLQCEGHARESAALSEVRQAHEGSARRG